MSEKKKSSKKTRLHPRNKHRDQYDLSVLTELVPELSKHIAKNKYGSDTVDFFNPEAVKSLNKALLVRHYGVTSWDIPAGYLCPPIPGRADYLHYAADLLTGRNFGNIPTGSKVTCLDIGTGANCVYPIIGNGEYGWSFVGTDIDPKAIDSAEKIVSANANLADKVEIRLQAKEGETFFGIIKKDERYDLTICNPPFHSSQEEAEAGTQRKLKNLKGKKAAKVELNFGGTSNELWTEGGEKAFILKMIKQSSQFAKSCFWFTTLVSKQSNLKHIVAALDKIGVMEKRTIPMGQGNKTSRIVAWTFLKKFEQKEWALERWAEVKENSEEPAKKISEKKAKEPVTKKKATATKDKVTVVKKKVAEKKVKEPATKKKATATKDKVTVVKKKVAEKKVKEPVTKKKDTVTKDKVTVVKKKVAEKKEKEPVTEKKATAAKEKVIVVKKKVAEKKVKESATKKKATVTKDKVTVAKKKVAEKKEKEPVTEKKATAAKEKVPAVKKKTAAVKKK